MAEAERILAALGAVPAGAIPKTILAGDANQEPGYYQTDPLSNLVRTLATQKLTIQDKLKKKQEAAQKKADMYKTLREAGYEPKAAYEAVTKATLTEPGKEDFSLKKTVKERIMDKIAKGEDLLPGEQTIYNDVIKKKGNGLDELDTEIPGESPTQKKTREDILDKIARGTPLQPGEQKIYDEVIKKKSVTPAQDLNSIVNNNEEMVPVVSPAGIKGSIPKSKLAVALKAGYKQR